MKLSYCPQPFTTMYSTFGMPPDEVTQPLKHVILFLLTVMCKHNITRTQTFRFSLLST